MQIAFGLVVVTIGFTAGQVPVAKLGMFNRELTHTLTVLTEASLGADRYVSRGFSLTWKSKCTVRNSMTTMRVTEACL